jgi:nucleotide-binding universal stress UspA family protein
MKHITHFDGVGRLPFNRSLKGEGKGKHIRQKAGIAKLKVERILVPLDFSEKSNQALAYAVALAADMKAKIILMHVIEPVYVSADPGLTCIPQLTTTEQKSDGKRMREIAAEFVPKGLFDKTVVRVGTPYHEITTAAKCLRADLIVIATHGRTGLDHVLMGSTAERVVRHASCPVLTVRRTQ